MAEFSLSGKSVFVTGHRGMVGAGIVRRLATEDCTVLTAGRETLDLTDKAGVDRYFEAAKPDVVVVAAAKVGGIHANNTQRGAFIYENLAIATNLIQASHVHEVGKLLFLGSSCIYPRLAPQPIREDSLLTGPLEPTNEPYAIAKIAGVKMCESYRRQYGDDFISVMPTNLYGPGDNYHPENSHVVAALIGRFHDAVTSGADRLTVWGTGTPKREFMHVSDMADACVFLLKTYSSEQIVNVGTGSDVTIRELATLIGEVVGFKGEIEFDATRPDGAPRKLLDVSRLSSLGWTSRVTLEDGLRDAYAAFRSGRQSMR